MNSAADRARFSCLVVPDGSGRPDPDWRWLSPLSAATDEVLDGCRDHWPAGFVLSSASVQAVDALAAKLAVREAVLGLADGGTGILSIVETPRAVLRLADVIGIGPRVSGLGWRADTLARALGAKADRGRDGALTMEMRSVRLQLLVAARSAGLAPIDTPSPCRDPERLAAECREARDVGFVGKLALDREQAATIRAVFG